MLKHIALGLMIFQLGACANGVRPEAMIADVTTDAVITDKSPLWKSTSIETIKGSAKTNPLWKSKVSRADFGKALKQTLALHALLNEGDEKYIINAQLKELRQPFLGFELAVTARVHYKITNVVDGSPIFDREVTETYTAKFNESYVFSERLKLANEGAVKANIKKFIHAYVAEGRKMAPMEAPVVAPGLVQLPKVKIPKTRQSAKSSLETGRPASSNS